MMGCSGSPDEGKQIGANPYCLSYSPTDEGVKVKVTFVVYYFGYLLLVLPIMCKLPVTPKYVCKRNMFVTDPCPLSVTHVT